MSCFGYPPRKVLAVSLWMLLLLVSLGGMASYAQSSNTEIRGEDIRIIDNTADVYDPKNDFIRDAMQKNAVLDAIEKGAYLLVKGGNAMFNEAFLRQATESNFENHVSKLLKKYNLKWRRTSSFEFSRVEEPADKRFLRFKRKWKASVSGVVEEDTNSILQKEKINWESQPTVAGESIKMLGNRLDIYDPSNDIVRDQMKLSAVFDAIGKKANIQLLGEKTSTLSSVSLNNKEILQNSEVSSLLEQYKIAWKRTSNYAFERLGKKKWRVRVQGLVVDHVDDPTADDDDFLSNTKTFIIENKSFNHVQVNIAETDVPYRQKHLIVYGTKEKKLVSGGTTLIKYPKAFLYITQQRPFTASAKIINGTWRIQKRDVVEIIPFNTKRQGFRYEVFTPQDGLMKLIRQEIAPSAIPYWGHSFAYFVQDDISNVGFSFGYKLLALNLSNNKDKYLHTLYGTIYYNWTLVPDILFLAPEIGAGMLLNSPSLSDERFKLNGDRETTYVNLEAKLALGFKISMVDLLVGYSYQHLFQSSGFSGLYPFLGLKVHFNRYKR